MEKNVQLVDESRESKIEGQKMPVSVKVKAKELQGKEEEIRPFNESKELLQNFYHNNQ